MSHPLIDRSTDLQALVSDGYEVEISASSNHVVIRSVPYVNAKREVRYGALVSVLSLANNATIKPENHVAYFIGEHPCNADGVELSGMKHSSGRQELDKGLTVDHSFSASAQSMGGYRDYHHKMTTYIGIISGPAQQLDPNATARTFALTESAAPDAVFKYADTASSRSRINVISGKLEGERVAIIGCGGTGSYVLDLVAKTRVAEIHIFDGDIFAQHNAFRSPGAAEGRDFEHRLTKAEYFASLYSRMRNGIIAHPYGITELNVSELESITFAFICIDDGKAKLPIVTKLEELGVAFVDVGMGLFKGGDTIGGLVRLTTSTPNKRQHVREKRRIGFDEVAADNIYDSNIQIAELNALNAALAVVKWKKLRNFYADQEHEHFAVFSVATNLIFNDDQET
jgi:hypothetical protein